MPPFEASTRRVTGPVRNVVQALDAHAQRLPVLSARRSP
jgi:hypothetical protein